MKIYLSRAILGCSLLLTSLSWSQTQQAPANSISPVESCGFDIVHQQRMMNDPVYFQNTVNINNALLNAATPKVGNTTLRVPVVVHVMDDGTSLTQITDEEIRQGIQRINERYRKVPGTLGDGNGVDTELEFVLAVRDPSGNCTDGIVRYDFSANSTYTSSGVFAQSSGVSDAFLKAQSFWNSSNYYNFWLVSEIDNNNGGAGIQGYAFFASAHGTAIDGTVMLCNNFKSSTSTTATHELGHAFNLYHTFEGDAGGGSCPPNSNCNTQGDRVCDTPPHVRSLSDCVLAPNPCDGGSSSALFIHNYMDYSSDACQSDFTAGQKVRINNAMTVTRASFLASNGNLSLVPPAPPVVDFQASADFFCIGNPIQFYDISSCIPNTFLDSTYWAGITFNWTFTDGTNTYTSTLQNPLMNFPSAGVYDVTLTVTNAQGTNTLTQPAFFAIGAPATAACIPSTNNAGNFAQTVSNVTFNSINNNTSQFANVGHTDYTCEFNTQVTSGNTYPISVDINAGGSAPEVLEVYIDYNNNGTFESGELVLSGTTGTPNNSVTVSGNVTIPGTAVQNTLLRMRVIGEGNTINNNERACLSSFFIGDVEDYGVYINPDCIVPTIALGTTSDPTTCSGTDGTIQITGSGSGTVDWTGAATGTSGTVSLPYTITGLAAGTYSIEFSTSPTCTSNTLSHTLSDPAGPTIAVGTTADPLSCGASDGTIQITGTGTGDISWSGTASGSSTGITLPFTITGLAAGTYSIDFTSSTGCASNTVSQTLTDPTPPTIFVGTTADPSVCLGSDGTIQVTGSGTGMVNWSGTASGTSGSVTLPYTITGLAAGTYSIDFTSSAGCASNTVSQTLIDPTPPTILVGTTADPSVCQGADGTIQITGSGTGDISWSGTATGTSGSVTLPYTITGLAAGTYSIDFTSSAGCASNTVSQTLIDPAAPTIAIGSGAGPTSCTGVNGTIQITGSGTGNISWSGTANGSSNGITLPFTITGLAAGTYSIDFTSSTGCASNTVSQTLIDPTPPTIVVGTTANPSVCLGSDGTIQINGSGSGDVTWSGASSGSSGATLPFTITGLAAGTYSIVFTESTGCVSNTVSQTLIDPAAPTIAIGTTADPSVCLGSDGTIQITGSGTGNISWSGTASGSSTGITLPFTITGLAAGTYSIDFTSSTGCASNTVSQTLTDPTPPAIAVGTFAGPTSCTGVNGTIQITGSGTGNISWSGTASGSSTGITLPFTITGLAAGTYSIDFTSSAGCASNTVSQTLIDPAAPTIANGTIADPSVCAASDGTIQITGSGTGNISWSGTASGSSTGITLPFTITGLAAGTYSIDFTSSTGCASNTVSQTLTDPTPPAIAVGTFAGPTSCTGVNGTIQITGSGTGNISWSGTANGSSNGITLPFTITGLAAGTYSIDFTSSTGCASNTVSQTLIDPTPPTIVVGTTADPSVCQGADGTIQINGSGSGDVTWSGASSGSSGATLPFTISGLAAGTYSIVFTESTGCVSNTVSQTLTNPAPPIIAVGSSADPSVCQGADGTIQITGSGTGDISWSGTAMGTSGSVTLPYTITGLAAGTYSIDFTSSAGCASNTVSQTLIDPAAPTIAIGSGAGPTSCTGVNGTIQITGSGTGNISWSGTASGSSNGITLPFTITGLAAGTYSIDFTSSTGCASNTVSQTLTDPTAPTIVVGTTADPSVCLGSDGTIQINGSGSGDVTWSGASSGSSGATLPFTITGLAAGSYSIVFTESTGCVSNTVSQTLTDPAPPIIAVGTSADPSVCQGADGTIQITGSGTGDISWSGTASGSSNGITLPFTITGLAAGTYSIDFTSSTGCASNTVSQILIDPAPPTIALGSFAGPLTCSGTDGIIQITGIGTGDISWSGTASGSSNGVTLPFTITGLAAGTYSIDFTSSTGCASNSVSQTLTDPAAPALPIITASGSTQFCAGGSVDLTSSFATGNVWSSTALTQTITVSTGGTFTVTHTDANGCSSTSNPITVNVDPLPSAPTITTSGTTTFCDGGSVDLTSSETSGNAWSNASIAQTITVTTTGNYDVTYTDGNGCSATSAPILVTANALPATPTISASGPTTFCDGQSVDLTSSELTSNVWSTTDVIQTITVSTSGSYDVTFTDGNGCSSTSTPTLVTVNALPAAPTITASGSTTLCAGQSVDLTSSEATGNLWSTTDVTQTITVSATGSYEVTYTDMNGCSATSAPTAVSGGNQPTVDGGADETVCEGEVVTLSGSGAQTYAWNNGISDNVPFTPPAGTTTYILTGTDANGCTNTDSVDVTVSPTPIVSLTTDATTCVYFAPSILVGTPAGGLFLGANVSGNQFDPASAGVGTHTIYYEFENADGCVGDATTTIVVEACASIDDVDGEELRVYPNPTQHVLNVELEGDFTISLHDSRGRLVYQDAGSNSIVISTENYETGIYMLTVSSDSINSMIRVLKQ